MQNLAIHRVPLHCYVIMRCYRLKTSTRWEIIDPYWANFIVGKLLCEYLSDSLQI